MSTTTNELSVQDLAGVRSWRRTKDRLATGLMILALVIVLVPLVAVLYTVISRGIGIISWQFLSAPIPPQISPANIGGMGPAVVGTLLITGVATLLAVPLGILAAIYLNEYGGTTPLARTVRFMSEVMTGVPSIVMGLFIFSLFVIHFGFSGFAGALALACLMLPVVIRSTEEMLRLVPNAQREASYALGSSKVRVIFGVVLPHSLGGIVSGALLAIARAAGETAPLLFTILTVTAVSTNVFHGPNTALPSQIFTNATSPFPGAQARAWGAALTLVALAFLLSLIARVITALATRHHR